MVNQDLVNLCSKYVLLDVSSVILGKFSCLLDLANQQSEDNTGFMG
jgi:hypothetical protein